MTHVLLPVTLLLRRAYLAELVWAALVARARGSGHRPIAQRLGIPGSTVRGWLRAAAARADAVRGWFLAVAVTAGVDVMVPREAESVWGDVLAAVDAAKTAITERFGSAAVLGAVTAAQVAVAASAGRLLSPGWPPAPTQDSATPVTPACDNSATTATAPRPICSACARHRDTVCSV
ncbi:helix-turn-helix domain-containing protein [Rhodococcus sp. NPDC057529]|uniref:helix-turn-helix domain-containing protein n=1 Tax=Rhodococcus sp. NPDC057529 TaxID=3346158 RepID=UPI00366EC0E9